MIIIEYLDAGVIYIINIALEVWIFRVRTQKNQRITQQRRIYLVTP